PGTIVTTNTSGLPIVQIAEGRSDDFRTSFLGTHFFNPPRAMKLLEVIPTSATKPSVVETIRRVGEYDLGKGVIVCKDTPNFIGNRLFTLDLTFAIEFALEHGYTVEEVDLLTGALIGRPKTATFRLLDLIGVDVMAFVAQNLYPRVPHDESRELLRAPHGTRLVQALQERGWLGNKSGVGFYRTVATAAGREFWPLDLKTMEHRPAQAPQFSSLATIAKERDLAARLRALIALEDRAGIYLRAVLGNYLGYASRRLPEIADDVRSVDQAMRWGFNHELGPFEIWDSLGVAAGCQLPGLDAAYWVDEMLRTGRARFYEESASHGHRATSYWNVSTRDAVVIPPSPDELDLNEQRASHGVITENDAASLIDLDDGVAGLELHTKMNTLDERVVEMINRSVEKVKSGFGALVVTGRGSHFSAGANLASFAGHVQANDWAGLDRAVRALQDSFLALRLSPQPVVIAPSGYALGGGAELTMAGARIVALAETYLGQVEVGVGLLPAAGGCKELLRRVVSAPGEVSRREREAGLGRVFELIALGKMSGSAIEAQEWGFLAPTDRIVMNPDHQLAMAKREALALLESYRPPGREKSVYAAGRDALATLRIKSYLAHESGYASAYDAELANRIAFVLCGGDLSEPQWVDEQYILDLERATFVELCQQPKTQERIRSFLETGKAVRN
ncbi:MAG TPA: 3-hydroxyacyl-CoA dehydrogenase/enoyl-CoA hydratase family protein, partial [Chloroflexota bacterium]|nr:3-hydroxyacyl-CoA dehydrogenase/enoyl-CoA hydratase family protein [Chloroflexota bacterium]